MAYEIVPSSNDPRKRESEADSESDFAQAQSLEPQAGAKSRVRAGGARTEGPRRR